MNTSRKTKNRLRMEKGDKVKVTAKDDNYGRTFVVDEIQSFGMTMPIVYLRHCNTFYYESELELVK